MRADCPCSAGEQYTRWLSSYCAWERRCEVGVLCQQLLGERLGGVLVGRESLSKVEQMAGQASDVGMFEDGIGCKRGTM